MCISFHARNASIFILSIRFGARGRNHTNHVEDDRLNLHLLRPRLPARRNPARHLPTVVPLPGARVQPAVDAPMGHRGNQALIPRVHRLDLLRHHLRRRTSLRLLCHHSHLVGMGVELDEGQAHDWCCAERVLIGNMLSL